MPFYHSTRMVSIGKIDRKDYYKFIAGKFKKAKKEINTEIINHILEISHGHTYYVQAIANFIYSQEKTVSSISDFDAIYKEFVLEKSVFYSELRSD